MIIDGSCCPEITSHNNLSSYWFTYFGSLIKYTGLDLVSGNPSTFLFVLSRKIEMLLEVQYLQKYSLRS